MRPAPSLVLLVSAVALLLVPGAGRGQGNQVAWLEVGSRRLSGANVLARWSALNVREREHYGARPSEQLRRYVKEELVLELLLAETARVQGLESDADYRRHKQAILAEVLAERLRRAEEARGVTGAEADSFFEHNRALFEKPERLRIARILVADRAQAEAVIEKARQLPSSEAWQILCREQSLDSTSRERGGDLGFVAEDGGVEGGLDRVDPSLFLAARAVKDGALVEHPVAEGERFAVVWRRGSSAPITSSAAQERERINGFLIEQRTRRKLARLLAELRQRARVTVDSRPLATLKVSSPD